MSMIQGLGLDYQVGGNDRGQTVTFTPADGSGTFPVAFAVYHELTVEEVAAAGGEFALGDRRWLLGAREFAGHPTPKQADKLTDASGTPWYIALEVTLDPLTNFLFVHTRRGR
jgi:hypothetical protein